MDAILIGTVLHTHDSVLARFLKNPLWNRKVFKAIIQWPDRMDLWEQFEGLLLAQKPRREGEAAHAMALYQANKADMDKGAVVSWPALRPIHKLMIRRAQGLARLILNSKTTRWLVRMHPFAPAFASG